MVDGGTIAWIVVAIALMVILYPAMNKFAESLDQMERSS